MDNLWKGLVTITSRSRISPQGDGFESTRILLRDRTYALFFQRGTQREKQIQTICMLEKGGAQDRSFVSSDLEHFKVPRLLCGEVDAT